MSKVFLVSTGSYSDYRIVGVFSSEEKAKAIAGILKEAEVEEKTLDPFVAELNEGLSVYSVRMSPNGDVETVERHDRDAEYTFDYRLKGTEEPLELLTWKDRPPVYLKLVFARDEQHAVKIVNELRVQAIAEQGVAP